MNALYGDGLVENDSDLLFTFLSRAPAWPVARAENRLDGEIGIF